MLTVAPGTNGCGTPGRFGNTARFETRPRRLTALSALPPASANDRAAGRRPRRRPGWRRPAGCRRPVGVDVALELPGVGERHRAADAGRSAGCGRTGWRQGSARRGRRGDRSAPVWRHVGRGRTAVGDDHGVDAEHARCRAGRSRCRCRACSRRRRGPWRSGTGGRGGRPSSPRRSRPCTPGPRRPRSTEPRAAAPGLGDEQVAAVAELEVPRAVEAAWRPPRPEPAVRRGRRRDHQREGSDERAQREALSSGTSSSERSVEPGTLSAHRSEMSSDSRLDS